MSDHVATDAPVDATPVAVDGTPAAVEATVPAVSAKTRTRIYVGCLIVNILAVTGFGLAVVFGVVSADKAATAGGIIIGGLNILSTGLAVGFRPTASAA